MTDNEWHKHKSNIYSDDLRGLSNVAVQWLTLFRRIQQLLDSTSVPTTGILIEVRGFPQASLQKPGQYLKQTAIVKFHVILKPSFRNHHNIRSYINYTDVEVSLNKPINLS
jgi:hypothetical protein